MKRKHHHHYLGLVKLDYQGPRVIRRREVAVLRTLLQRLEDCHLVDDMDVDRTGQGEAAAGGGGGGVMTRAGSRKRPR